MWSLRSSDNTRSVLTQNQTEAREMISSGAWTERCNPIAGPTVFCVNTVSDLWHVAEVFFLTFTRFQQTPSKLKLGFVPIRHCSMRETVRSCSTLYVWRYG